MIPLHIDLPHAYLSDTLKLTLKWSKIPLLFLAWLWIEKVIWGDPKSILFSWSPIMAVVIFCIAVFAFIKVDADAQGPILKAANQLVRQAQFRLTRPPETGHYYETDCSGNLQRHEVVTIWFAVHDSESAITLFVHQISGFGTDCASLSFPQAYYGPNGYLHWGFQAVMDSISVSSL